MNELYHDPEYMRTILAMLTHDLGYLEKWSVYNDDKFLETIVALRQQFSALAPKIESEVFTDDDRADNEDSDSQLLSEV